MSSRIHVVAFAAAGVCVLAEPVLSEPIFNLPSPDANRQAPLRGTGIDAYLSLTQFYDALVKGPPRSDTDWKYGGKADLHVTVDGSRFALWDGYSISALGELIYGQSLNTSDAGMVFPVNTAMDFTQRFGGVASPKVGKVNTVNLATGTPDVVGGDRTSKVGGSDFDPTPAVGPRPSTKLGRIGQRLSLLRARLMGFFHRPELSLAQPSPAGTDIGSSEKTR